MRYTHIWLLHEKIPCYESHSQEKHSFLFNKDSRGRSNREKDNRKDDEDIMEVPVNDMADAIFRNHTSFSVCVFNFNTYRQVDLYVDIQRNKGSKNPIYDAILSKVNYMRESFYKYCFHYSHGTLSPALHPKVCGANIATISIGSMPVGNRVLKSRVKFLFLNGYHCLGATQKMQVKSELR